MKTINSLFVILLIALSGYAVWHDWPRKNKLQEMYQPSDSFQVNSDLQGGEPSITIGDADGVEYFYNNDRHFYRHRY